jgi:hypothetical protein
MMKPAFDVAEVEAFCPSCAKHGLQFRTTHQPNGYVFPNANDPRKHSIFVSSRAFRETARRLRARSIGRLRGAREGRRADRQGSWLFVVVAGRGYYLKQTGRMLVRAFELGRNEFFTTIVGISPSGIGMSAN